MVKLSPEALYGGAAGKGSQRTGSVWREVPSELRDREVSVRVLLPLMEAARAKAVAPERLAFGTGYSVADLSDPRGRISWSGFVRFMANLSAHFDDAALVTLGATSLESPFLRALLLPGRLLFTTTEVYLWVFSPEGPASSLFVTHEGRIERVGDDHLRFETRMKPGYEPSRENYLVLRGSLMGLSKALGAGLADVTFEARDAGAVYEIRLRHKGGALSFARRGLDWVFAARSTAEELRRANAELHQGYVALQREVAARIEAEAELRRLNEALEARVRERTAALEAETAEREAMREALWRSEKLASIGLLSAGIAHEINNPMAYVASNLYVLQKYVVALVSLVGAYEAAHEALASVDPEAARRVADLSTANDLPYIRSNAEALLARTREGVTRVTRIIDGLRNLARTEDPVIVPADLRDLADASLEVIRGRLERRGIEVAFEWGDDTVVPCVPMLVTQVLLNLLTNAMQAVESAHPSGGGRIVIASRKGADEQVLDVTDNGCGIAAEALPRLFDPFFTTKPPGEGTGLGLAITHSIVASHGGRLEVSSRVGEGTRMRVHLPLDAKRAAGRAR